MSAFISRLQKPPPTVCLPLSLTYRLHDTDSVCWRNWIFVTDPPRLQCTKVKLFLLPTKQTKTKSSERESILLQLQCLFADVLKVPKITSLKCDKTGLRGLLPYVQDCKSSGEGCTPGRGRVRNFSVLPSQPLCRLVNFCLAFVCAARTKIRSGS